MNAARRKAISTLISRLEAFEAERDEIVSEIESLRDEEQDYYDNMPENMQAGEKGDRAEAAADALSAAVDELSEFDLSSVRGSLETAAE